MRRSCNSSAPGWTLTVVLPILVLATFCSPAIAQKCSDRNPDRAAAKLGHILRVCSSPDPQDQVADESATLGDVWTLAVVAGPRAVPVLRKLVALPESNDCFGTITAFERSRLALAKLGDQSTYSEMKKAWMGETPSPYLGSLGLFAEVGDDWALFTLIQYLIEHADDSRLLTDFGPTDAPYDGQSELVQEIQDIARIRHIPELPDAWYSPQDVARWRAWLDKYKGHRFAVAVSQNVSDPYVQCLARKVDWGMPDAMLDIARFGRQPARHVLGQFPRPKPGQPMGARDFFTESLRYEDLGLLDPYQVAQGNLEAGLAVLGDQEMLAQIASELKDFPYYPGNAPLEAVRKLQFIGGRPAVSILVDALGNLHGMEREAEGYFEECAQPSVYTGLHLTPEQLQNLRKSCDHDRYFGHVRDTNALILETLGEMVKNSPLPSNAQATPDNFQKWKEWWILNKDHSVFASQRPVQSLE